MYVSLHKGDADNNNPNNEMFKMRLILGLTFQDSN